jgi:hypothetical protein
MKIITLITDPAQVRKILRPSPLRDRDSRGNLEKLHRAGNRSGFL